VKEYTIAALAVLVLALALVTALGLSRDRALWAGLLVFAVMTVAADMALTGIGVYGYDRRFNAGIYLGRMPLEDLAYGLALYLVAVAAWRGWEAHAG
jgi:lycopene cyclase domain-containing protein